MRYVGKTEEAPYVRLPAPPSPERKRPASEISETSEEEEDGDDEGDEGESLDGSSADEDDRREDEANEAEEVRDAQAEAARVMRHHENEKMLRKAERDSKKPRIVVRDEELVSAVEVKESPAVEEPADAPMYTPEQSARLKQWGTAEVQDPVKFLQEMQYMKKFGLEALTYLIARGEPIPVVSDPDPCVAAILKESGPQESYVSVPMVMVVPQDAPLEDDIKGQDAELELHSPVHVEEPAKGMFHRFAMFDLSRFMDLFF